MTAISRIVSAIGAFDGLHLGHQSLMRSAQKIAGEIEAEWAIVTFSKEKSDIFNKKSAMLLFSQSEQIMLERMFSVPRVIRLDFDDRLRTMRPDDFLSMLCAEHEVVGFAVGHDFRFGRDRSGDSDTLMRYSRERGYRAEILQIVTDPEGREISSTAIRGLIAAGEMERAGSMLGYPFFLTGTVGHGYARGRKMGYPTANVGAPSWKLAPSDGVYSAFASVDDELYVAAVNVGMNPTFRDVRDRRIEVNLIDRTVDLYGRTITVFFLSKIRDEITFSSIEELSAQIAQDIAVIRDSASAVDEHIVRTMRTIGRQAV